MKKTKRNPGAGRKPNPFKSQSLWVPAPLLPEIKKMIKAYKAKKLA